MTDDRLTRELERRSKSVTHSSEWARHELLPSIRFAIDSRPQRVATSRGPALAGLAGAVAILLVLVVAMPRITPGPSGAAMTTNPATTPPSAGTTIPSDHLPVMSAQEFASALAAGQLRSSTVLVNGSINGWMPSRGCEPPTPCFMGQLERTDGAVFVVSGWIHSDEQHATRIVTDSSDSWSWWYQPEGPESGALLLSVDSGGQVEFIGTADKTAQSPVEPLSVADAAAIDITSVPLDEVVLVEGWLSTPEGPGVSVNIDCIMPSSSPIPHLPSRYCQPTSSLTDEYRASGRGLVTTTTASLAVQRSAAQSYGVRTDQNSRVFAIAPRLYGQCFPGPPPCWQWDVVARISDTPVGEPVPTPPAPPSDSPSPITEGLPCGSDSFSISLIDRTGLVTGCSPWFWDPGQMLGGSSKVTNPTGDLSALLVEWVPNSGCINRASVEFIPEGDRYRLVITEGPNVSACLGPYSVNGFEISLADTVVADRVSVIVREESSAPTPSASPESVTLECSPEPDQMGGNGPSSWHATLHDEIGLVESCEGVLPTDTSLPVLNPDGDPRVLELTWSGRPCDAEADVTLSRLADGYSVHGILYNTICRSSLVGHALLVRLRADVSADLVLSLFDRHTPPAPTPSPSAPGTRMFDCAYSDGSGRSTEIRFVDHSGSVPGCSARMDPAELPPVGDSVVVSDGPLISTIDVTWAADSSTAPCLSRPVELELWGPLNNAASGQPDYVLRVARLTGTSTEICDPPATQSVNIFITRGFGAYDVDAFLTDESSDAGGNVSTVSAATDKGSFALSLVALNMDFTANEPIDSVEARLVYEGDQHSLRLPGWPSPELWFRQLDGDLVLHTYGHLPIGHISCEGINLEAGSPGLVSHLQPSGLLSDSDPNYDFFSQYMYDGQFRLPSGTYEISTVSSFGGCSDASVQIRLQTSIVIHVR